jgi:hypothetical protein
VTLPPERIGPYTIARELGRGGMGVVYLATDTRLDRQVAIKALPAELASDPARLERFEREAKTLAQLNHPNLAGIHGVEEQDGARYLVLEYVEGEALAAAGDPACGKEPLRRAAWLHLSRPRISDPSSVQLRYLLSEALRGGPGDCAPPDWHSGRSGTGRRQTILRSLWKMRSILMRQSGRGSS